MTAVFRPTEPSDLDRVQEFLIRSFPSDKSSPLWRPEALQWRYWQPRPGWDGSRGYVIERAGKILAHGAAWPMRLSCASENTPGFFFCDWAADPASPGMGAAVLQEMCAVAGVSWLCGGTPQSETMWSATGFRAMQTVSIYALPLRPLNIERHRMQLGWNAARRIFRNELQFWRAARPDDGWDAIPLDLARSVSSHRNRPCAFPSSFEYADYYAQCPIAKVSWHEVREQGEGRGYFVLVRVPGSARIAEAVLDRADTESWKNLSALAAKVAASFGCDEIMAWASLREMNSGLAAAGFRRCAQQELMACGPTSDFAQNELDLQLVHGDMAFYHSGSPWYLS